MKAMYYGKNNKISLKKIIGVHLVPSKRSLLEAGDFAEKFCTEKQSEYRRVPPSLHTQPDPRLDVPPEKASPTVTENPPAAKRSLH